MIPISRLVHATWRTSSYSSSTGGNCVEVAQIDHVVGIRDTKDRNRGHLNVSRETFEVFVRSITS